jgi:hypothetical protein
LRRSVDVAALVGVLCGACFQGDFLAGLPCSDDDECGDLQCIGGVCGGGDGGQTSGQPTDDDATSSASFTTTTATTGQDTTAVTTDSTQTSTTTTDDTTTGDDTGCEPTACPCNPAPHVPCDDVDALAEALGLCPGEVDVTVGIDADPVSHGTFESVGGFSPREGARFAVLGSGRIDELNVQSATNCNDDIAGGTLAALPDPMTTTPAPEACFDNPAIIDMGLDCSMVLDGEITFPIHDYAGLTLQLEVPPGITSASFQFAFSSLEYPDFVDQNFNDLFVAWIVSEQWTGNVSFYNDLPISVNSGLFTATDDNMTNPLFAGTCLRGHGSTNWLTTRFPVTAGEDLTLVFAVFDAVDGSFDSYVFLDEFEWGCAPPGPPSTSF